MIQWLQRKILQTRKTPSFTHQNSKNALGDLKSAELNSNFHDVHHCILHHQSFCIPTIQQSIFKYEAKYASERLLLT